MPELPEVETMCRGIAGIIGGKIVEVQRLPCAVKPLLITPTLAEFKRRVVGERVERITRAGKRVVIWLKSTDCILLEPRMSGLVLIEDPPTYEHLRWKMRLEKCETTEVQYWDRRGLGSVRLLRRMEFETLYGPHRLGPDALTITADQLSENLCKSRREIKVALLDQKKIAGIGNLYAAEILHLAGIHPQRQCNRMSHAQWESLARATRKILAEAILYEGSTLGDGTYRNALNESGGYQNKHLVYDRAGKPCCSCSGGTIQRFVQAQRSTFFCPNCQKKNSVRVVSE